MNPQKVTGLGDWASLPGEGMWTTVARPNYFMVGYFHAYAKASGDMYWMQAIEAVQTQDRRHADQAQPHDRLDPAVPGRRHEPAGRQPPGRRQRA